MDLGRPWMGMGKPCNEEDMKLFYVCINMDIGNGKTAQFWHSPWLGGAAPKDIAPSIFSLSCKKNFEVCKGLEQDFWVSNLSFVGDITVAHITEFYNLWTKIQYVQLTEDPDSITWRLTTSATYSSALAYLAQFYDPPNVSHGSAG
jgi:hypothetical protein